MGSIAWSTRANVTGSRPSIAFARRPPTCDRCRSIPTTPPGSPTASAASTATSSGWEIATPSTTTTCADFLPLRITQTELFVYGPSLACIGRYELRPRGRGEKVDPLGLHPRADRQAVIDVDKLRTAFEQMGDGAAAFLPQLSAAHSTRVWAHHARQILLLRARYDSADVDAALAHAARFGALDTSSIERILASRSRPRTLEEYVAEDTAQRIDAVLGPTVTRPRDLAEYDALPRATRTPSEPSHGQDQNGSG
jgi:hypothetical protein